MASSFELAVIDVKQETHDVTSVKFSKPKNFDSKPGQYLMLELDISDPSNLRPLSIASSPTEDFLLFSTKISESEFKKKFSSLKSGDKAKAKGPMGFFVLKEDAKETVFLGGGIGITPFRDMIKYATDKKLPIKMTLLYSNKTPDDICYRDEWHVFERENPNLKVINTITKPEGTGWSGRTGRIDDSMIKEFCSDLQNTVFYICGPSGMVNALSELLKSMNLPQQNINVEIFPGY